MISERHLGLKRIIGLTKKNHHEKIIYCDKLHVIAICHKSICQQKQMQNAAYRQRHCVWRDARICAGGRQIYRHHIIPPAQSRADKHTQQQGTSTQSISG